MGAPQPVGGLPFRAHAGSPPARVGENNEKDSKILSNLHLSA
jgi:hypothetical protein